MIYLHIKIWEEFQVHLILDIGLGSVFFEISSGYPNTVEFKNCKTSQPSFFKWGYYGPQKFMDLPKVTQLFRIGIQTVASLLLIKKIKESQGNRVGSAEMGIII